MTILDMRGLRDRLTRMLAQAPVEPAPEARLPPAYLRDLFDDPLVASWDALSPPAHVVESRYTDMRRGSR